MNEPGITCGKLQDKTKKTSIQKTIQKQYLMHTQVFHRQNQPQGVD
jgi:hypothetical protein